MKRECPQDTEFKWVVAFRSYGTALHFN